MMPRIVNKICSLLKLLLFAGLFLTSLYSATAVQIPVRITFNGFKTGTTVDLNDYRSILNDLRDIISKQPGFTFHEPEGRIPQGNYSGVSPCLDLPCLLQEANKTESRVILTGFISKSGNNYKIRIDILLAGSGKNIYTQTIQVPIKASKAVGGREIAKYLVYGINKNFPAMVIPVTSNPSGANVYLDGQEIGRSPFNLMVREGFSYEFKARSGFSVSEPRQLMFGGRNESRVHLKLVPEPGSLEITGFPTGAIVKVDGQKLGTLPRARIKAKAGQYSVNVQKSGFSSFKEVVSIEPGSLTELNVQLKKKPKSLALMSSAILPGAGHFIYKQPVRGLLFLATSAAVGYYGYEQYMIYLNKTNAYQEQLRIFKRNPDLNTWDEKEQEIMNSYQDAKNQAEIMNQILNVYGAIWTITLLELAID